MQLQWKICTSVDQIEQWSQEMFWKIVHLKILKNASIMVLICKIFWGRKRVNNRKRFWVALIANCNWLFVWKRTQVLRGVLNFPSKVEKSLQNSPICLHHTFFLTSKNIRKLQRFLIFSGGWESVQLWQMSPQWGSQKLLQELVSHALTAYLSIFNLFKLSELWRYYQKHVNQIILNHATLWSLALQIFQPFRILLIVNNTLNQTLQTFWLYARQTRMAQLILAISLW